MAEAQKKSENKVVKFFKEVKSEMKKVAWPSRKQVVKNTLIVMAVVVLIGLFIWAANEDPIPGPLLAFLMAFPIVTIGGVLLALKERIKQIEGGEEDAARKY